MYLTKYEDVLKAIEEINKENYSNFFMLAVNANPVEKIFIQRLVRYINGKECEFLSIRDIKIEEKNQKSKIFSKILETLESKNIPIMIDDIINDNLDNHLMKRGYIPYKYQKNNSNIRSRYKIPKNN